MDKFKEYQLPSDLSSRLGDDGPGIDKVEQTIAGLGLLKAVERPYNFVSSQIGEIADSNNGSSDGEPVAIVAELDVSC